MDNKKGVIQIIHGMSEHRGRYSHFFKYFEEQQWIIEMEEHIHHRDKKESDEKIGIFQNDFNKMIENQINFTKKLREKYPDKKIYIFGHSMGSFIAQEHMKKFNKEVAGYIICGSCYEQKILWNLGKIFSNLLDKIYKNKRASIIRKLIFLNSNKKIKSNNYYNENSWLSRDIEEVKKYSSDKNCGFTYSSSFYKEFFIFLNKLYNRNEFELINKDLPILIISGDMDPVGLHGKGVRALEKFYKKLNFKNLTLKLYKEARHELHNEINREEVFEDIKKWLEKN
ncbi:alpha/beta fold hydrolase [Fusobacterium perfoetens]|uniref:alpha/beta fold hydrolase n=1 Tax=Fusobacterium perfoetens TaxID=852 RepID=UPI000483BDBF|nr:alpha/beta hydrolase [Fusobacterium perfoetens]MCI6153455.1 alpha/beta hydrolase [Fusobacterium perfoetens]MDY3238402.1 alpha/beta hydrolase [Fusobacterium perfoetens]